MNKNPHNRPTIGFLSAEMHIGSSRLLWTGILDAAIEKNVNLICFNGGYLLTDKSDQAMRNMVYQQVDINQIDGLIIRSGLMSKVTTNEAADFYKSYQAIPLVELGASIENVPTVEINDKEGMQALLLHLIEKHGYRKFAFLRGPDNHPYAQERYHVFLDTLHEKGLETNERLITPPTGWTQGAKAMSVLLDERDLQPGRDFEVLVTVSDLLAVEAIRMMAKRGIHVPADVAVTGFNDIEEGRLADPPLTTVALPFHEQGLQSMQTLLACLADDCEPQNILHSRLLIRQSCGCPSLSEKLAKIELSGVTHTSTPQSRSQTQEQIAAEIFRIIPNRGIATTWAKQMLDAFYSELDGIGNGRFRTTLVGMLQQGILDSDEPAIWQNTISIIRSGLLSTLSGEQRERAEALCGQARVVIGDVVHRTQIARLVQAERQSGLLRDIGQALITTFDVGGLADVLAEQLLALNIRSAYLALYGDPDNPLETSRLVLAYTENGRFDLGENGRCYPSSQLLPPDVLPDRRFTLLVEPLFFQEEPLGIIVFEVAPRDGGIYEVLRGHISSALKGALLIQQIQESKGELERRIDNRTKELKLRNAELERFTYTVSHDLKSPLITIQGFLSFLEKDAINGNIDQLKKDIVYISNATVQMRTLLDDLLELSRIGRVINPPEAILLNDLIKEAVSITSGQIEAKNVQIIVEPDLPIIYGDRLRLFEVMQNLIDNAVKFVGQQPNPRIEIGAISKETEILCFVRDNGVGIKPQYHETVFGLFDRLDPSIEGTGIGLALVKQIIEIHNGTIWVESAGDGNGATFYFTLPIENGQENNQ